MAFLVSCAWLAVVAWLIARSFVQRGYLPAIRRAPLQDKETAAEVLIIVPARNEAANIRRCLLSLANQTHPHLRIVTVDDHSADDTLAIASAAAAEHPEISVLSSPVLPPDWVGKSHACWTAVSLAACEAEWLCFIDADVEAQPELLSSAVAHAASESLVLLSLSPRQELKSFAERLIMPCGLYCLAFWQDLRKLQSPDCSDATVTGQFMLVRRRDYEAVGGHAAVRKAICEDVALARLIKRAGGRVALCDGGGLLSTRMYTGWRSLWPGLTKNIVEMLGGPLPTFQAAVMGLILAWAVVLVPFADVYGCAEGQWGACMGIGPAFLASGALLGFHLAGARHFRIPLWYGLLFPVGYTAGAVMAIDSVRRRLRGRVVWKGRIYS